MAPRNRTNAAIAEVAADQLTPEESALMDANRAAEREPVEEAPEAPEPAAAPAPAPESQPATAAPAQAAEAKPVEEGKTVDLRALHEERERRKAIQKERDELKVAQARTEERIATIQQLINASQKQNQEQIPDATVDPIAHFQARAAQAERQLQEMAQWRQQQEQQSQQQQLIQRIADAAGQHERAFAAEHADYSDATAYVQNMRDAQLEMMGYTDPVQRQNQLRMEALSLAAQELQAGRNPAELIYKMAQRTGWKPKEAAPAAPTPAPAAAAPAPQPAPTAAATAKLTKVAEGQAANQSLGAVNGSAPAELSLKAILDLPDDEFAKLTSNPKKWREIAGA